jgi:hypothetical protein
MARQGCRAAEHGAAETLNRPAGSSALQQSNQQHVFVRPLQATHARMQMQLQFLH